MPSFTTLRYLASIYKELFYGVFSTNSFSDILNSNVLSNINNPLQYIHKFIYLDENISCYTYIVNSRVTLTKSRLVLENHIER